ncbi:MAG: 4Fe-4S binding protein, partial [Eggerthellaceae bacterium]|nr:4Fe-4S binding protein [Eggerthellaceae bacterium]
MNAQKLRVIIPLAVLLIAGLGFTLNVDFGTLSAAGWSTISILCPLGALSAMLAAKMMIPRAIVSLVLFVIIVLLVGRAFCAWVCPTPLISRLRGLFTKKGSDADLPKEVDTSALTEKEKQYLRVACGGTCATPHKTLDSRHIVLGGSLLSAAIFGFPVFCLVCPIGLSFALIFFLVRAFGFGDPSWALLIIPIVLILELVVFRKWCHWICPVSALMSLVAKGNKTVLPTVDTDKCLE